MNNFKNLRVWQDSIELAVKIYQVSDKFPKSEQFNLTSQMRRAGVSVPSNIAESARRNTKKDFDHFLCISNGSTNEIETQMIIAQRLGFITIDDLNDLSSNIDAIQKKIFRLKETLK